MPDPTFEPVLAPSVAGKRSPWNIYTTLLILGLVSLVTTMIVLYLEIRSYGGFGVVGGPQS